ncbi:MAG: selenocysteine-specific translation elongation factor [Bacillota bacterium]
MDQLIIGTAGHVDHGKTVLISALTDVDTDRLKEEKKRGISIDLGFAPFKLPSGRIAGVVDVPGHERFIHNMLAGAAGMDLVMLVVDASEGVMPQTREHLDILQLLGVRNGIVVITKIDLADQEWRELVKDEIKDELKGTFLENAPIHAVSAHTGEGVEELRQLIDELTAGLENRNASGPLRLPIDRSFVIAGFGTVVTGTLVQGSVRVGDTVAVVPPEQEARVRNIQVHEQDVKEARAGSRVALNLSGLDKNEVLRGSVVSSPGYYRPTILIDVSVELLARSKRRLKNLDPVHFFLGTGRSVARILLLDRDELNPGENCLAQCRLDRGLVAERGDPFVIRSYSPMTTIGGGMILDPYPPKHRRFRSQVIAYLEELRKAPAAGGDAAFVHSKLEEMIVASIESLVKETRLDRETINHILEENKQKGFVEQLDDAYIMAAKLKEYEQVLLHELEKYHQKYPLSPGISRARLKGVLPKAFGQKEYDALLKRLEENEQISGKSELVNLYGFAPEPSGKDKKQLDHLIGVYRAGWLQPPSVKNAIEEAGIDPARKDEFFQYLQNANILVKVNEELYFHSDAYREANSLLSGHFASESNLTLAQFRDLAGTSRKYAQALLEHFDQQKLTRRIEDYRVPFKLDLNQESTSGKNDK